MDTHAIHHMFCCQKEKEEFCIVIPLDGWEWVRRNSWHAARNGAHHLAFFNLLCDGGHAKFKIGQNVYWTNSLHVPDLSDYIISII